VKNTISFLIFILFTISQVVLAAPALTYHGRLLNPDGTPVLSSVDFKIQIRSNPPSDCLLYEETQTQDLTTTNGVFALGINDGTGTRTDAGTYSVAQIFSNRITLTLGAANCSFGSTYTPSASDARVLKVSFNDGTFAGWEDGPTQALNFVPKAIDSLTVGGFAAANLLRFTDGAGGLINTSPLNLASYTELLSLIAGTSTQYLNASTSLGTTIPNLATAPSSPTAGAMWYDSVANNMKYYNTKP
jgi:hypothetical protein